MKRIVITGLGAASPYGAGVAAYWKGLAGGACAIRELTLIGTDGFRCRLAAAVPEPLAGAARRTRADRLAIGAAGEALADAGLGARDRAAAALVVGAVGGGMLEAEAWYWRHARDGTRPASLSAVRAMLPSAHAETLASRFRLGGPRHTVVTACSSGGAARGAVRQRPRHRHAAERPHRGARAGARVRRGRPARVLEQVDDRPHDGRRRQPRGHRDRARARARPGAADREPGHAGSGRSLRLRAARGARGGPHVRDLQLVRLRRPERDAALPARRRPMTRPGVAITGGGVVSAAVTGDSAALGAFLAAPAAPAGEALSAGALAAVVDPDDARRLSRVCQFTIAAARLALRESGVDPAAGLGLVVGTELGDLASTHAFADGFLERGPGGLSALLFPNTVMNTMVATTAIAVGAREMALTLNAPTVAGELAVARAAAALASGRVPAMLAGGVDELDPVVERELARLGFGAERRGEGAAFVVLEPRAAADARGARPAGPRPRARARARRHPRRAGGRRRVIPFVVVPAHDEATTVGDVVRRARIHAPVIVVDDGSTDGTAEAAVAAGAAVRRHARRLGKAQALRTGVVAARARGATHVVTLDADGQHDPDDVSTLLAATAPRTLVVGARRTGDGALPAGRAEAIVVAGFFVNWASGLRLAGPPSGFRVYPVAIFDEVPARRGGFVFETEVLLAAA